LPLFMAPTPQLFQDLVGESKGRLHSDIILALLLVSQMCLGQGRLSCSESCTLWQSYTVRDNGWVR
jgi:hypothetical protein